MSKEIQSPQAFNIQSLTKTIAEGVEKTESLFSSASIYRVPQELRKMKKSAYTPRHIDIGPLHRNDEHLKTPMQYVKMSYTNALLRRTQGVRDRPWSMVLEECVAGMKPLIDDAKKWYAEEVTLDEGMMVVDGCFILELLYRNYLNKKHPKERVNSLEEGKRARGDIGNTQALSSTESPLGVQESIKSSGKQKMADPIFDSIFPANTIQLDLLLLENQIPYFVLEKLFDLTIYKIPNRLDTNTLNELVDAYLGNMLSPKDNSKAKGSALTANCGSLSDCCLRIFGNKKPKEEKVLSSGKYNHILHKLHEDYLPCHQPEQTDFTELMHSASDLDYAGVKFVPITGTGKDLFNVNFIELPGLFWWCHRAHFEIPRLEIEDHTEALLRNLIAFEQCCPGVSQHFTSYAYLMDMLVNTEKDIETLQKARVIRNILGAKQDAANLFNKLCKETIVREFFFAETCNKAIKYSKRSWPKYMAHWRREYFSSPWTFIVFCMGFIVSSTSIASLIRDFLA